MQGRQICGRVVNVWMEFFNTQTAKPEPLARPGFTKTKGISIMASNTDEFQTRVLDDEQITNARQLLGCGVPVHRVADLFSLPEERLREILGLPVWKPEPQRGPWWKGVLQ
jgi:hypothetical protein